MGKNGEEIFAEGDTAVSPPRLVLASFPRPPYLVLIVPLTTTSSNSSSEITASAVCYQERQVAVIEATTGITIVASVAAAAALVSAYSLACPSFLVGLFVYVSIRSSICRFVAGYLI